MLKLNELEENKIPYSWRTLFVGKKDGFLTNPQIIKYASDFIMDHSDKINRFIIELASYHERVFLDDVLAKIVDIFGETIDENDAMWFIEERKLRFCALINLQKNILDERMLLDKIEEVYADFGYPEDMDDFIYYVTPKDYEPSKHSEKECIDRLIRIFREFLDKEKQFLRENG